MFNAIKSALNRVDELFNGPKTVNNSFRLMISFDGKSKFSFSCLDESFNSSSVWKNQKVFNDWTESLNNEDLLIISKIFKQRNIFEFESCVMHSFSKDSFEHVVKGEEVISTLKKEINLFKNQSDQTNVMSEQSPLLLDKKESYN